MGYLLIPAVIAIVGLVGCPSDSNRPVARLPKRPLELREEFVALIPPRQLPSGYG